MKVIAHRGANKYYPQNTIPAFQKAAQLGADGIETDVHLTKDGQVVICHDYTINGTSDGTGDINLMTLAELRQFDFGSYRGEQFAGIRIPTLEQLFEVVGGLEIINIEVKPPRDHSMLIVEKTLAIAERFGLTEKLLISSFDCDVILAAKQIDGRIKTGMLYSIVEEETPHLEELLDDPAAFVKPYRADALHPFVMMMSEEYIADAHAAGLAVNPWTVNSPDAIQYLLTLGCDGIITDTPDIAIKAIAAQEQ
ncbi:MAG: glycerophosphodiester phosphodiesterase [Oscillospiraceae bacterium]|jgi:glycerophosphoryl diester phosphodiesterase|nr:glycerophosphodiester phosphodiesterase [Oscillospiraceae bacterium]